MSLGNKLEIIIEKTGIFNFNRCKFIKTQRNIIEQHHY